MPMAPAAATTNTGLTNDQLAAFAQQQQQQMMIAGQIAAAQIAMQQQQQAAAHQFAMQQQYAGAGIPFGMAMPHYPTAGINYLGGTGFSNPMLSAAAMPQQHQQQPIAADNTIPSTQDSGTTEETATTEDNSPKGKENTLYYS